MPLLDIISAQPPLQIYLATLRARSLVDGRALLSSFISGNKTRLVSSRKSLNLPIKLPSNVSSFEIKRGRIVVKAVATFETKDLVQEHNEQKGSKNSLLEIGSSPTTESADEDSAELDEREKVRRMKISKANKGKIPWNLGRKHSAETIQRIKERTRIAMQDPKVRLKQVKLGHAQTVQTKEKIGVGVKRRWKWRQKMLGLQESCRFEWQNVIAEASRTGYVGEEELQWDSYKILSEQLRKEWLEIRKQKKTMKTPKCRRAPKSPEQRRKIAATIAAKWATPEYRARVLSGLSKYHGTPVGTGKKPRRKPSSSTSQSPRQTRPKKAREIQFSFMKEDKIETRKPKKRVPKYKDPLASSKLEMIKNIRAQRAAAEARKAVAIARARLSIAEAEKAAKALEPAAVTSSIAREALLETRKLIEEAIKSVEALEAGHTTTNETNGEELSDASFELDSHFEEDKDEFLNQAELININGTQTHTTKISGYPKVSVQDILLNDEEVFVSTTSSRKRKKLPRLNVEDLVKQLGATSTDQPSQLETNGSSIDLEQGPSPNGAFDPTIDEESCVSVAKTKKWVRGRLIEVSEEESEEQQDMSDEEEDMSDEEEDLSGSEEDQSHDGEEALSGSEEDESHDGEEALSEEVEDQNHVDGDVNIGG